MSEWLDETLDLDAHPVGSAVKETAGETPKEPTPLTVAIRTEQALAAVESSPIPAAKAALLRSILRNIRESVNNALQLLDMGAEGALAEAITDMAGVVQPAPRPAQAVDNNDRMVEGVFNGDGMVGADGKIYAIPPNYASKSKLVEGDMLKLTIGSHGNFIYKQIGPIERQRLVGTLVFEQDVSQFSVLAQGRTWRVLKASVTYFKGEAGDEAIVLAPKNAPSKWAAVENIIKKQV